MNNRITIGLLALISLLTLLLSGCSSGGGSSTEETPSPKFYFKASNTGASDQFGSAVALSGDGSTLAIGAYAEQGDGLDESNDNVAGAGAVYVFKRSVVGDTVSWSQVAYVKAPTPATSENFGFSVSLNQDGSKLAVGAPDINGMTLEGKVYVYTSPNYDTTPGAYAEITDPSVSMTKIGDRFGQAVALSGDGTRLAIGSPGDDVGASNAGAAYVYFDSGNNNNWALEDSLNPSTDTGAGLGVSVALNQDGSVLAAGAWLEDDTGTDEGAVYSYTRSGTTWTAVTKLLAATPVTDDRFGAAVSLNDNGTRLAVGAPSDFVTLTGSGGAVYVYDGSGTPITSWINEKIVTASNAEADDAFGIAVQLNSTGNTLLVGASYEDGSGTDIDSTPDTVNGASNSGAAYLFTYAANWTQQSYIKATNTDGGDQFGARVSMNDSGNRLVVGAQNEQSNATGVNGDQTDDSLGGAGAAYLWNL